MFLPERSKRDGLPVVVVHPEGARDLKPSALGLARLKLNEHAEVTMNGKARKEKPKKRRWVAILAGGEGERMRPLVTSWLGRHLPKQYCTFVGSRSMLQHTLDRAVTLVSSDRILTVIGQGHSVFLNGLYQKSSIPGLVIEQPANCDTVPGIFLPLTYIRAADPLATVIIFPSDHFIFPEGRFVEHVEKAAEMAERLKDRLIVLAAEADRAEAQYGWIEPGSSLEMNGSCAYPVLRFHEKPSAMEAEFFYRKGYLWNTMVMAVKVETLWNLGKRYFPDMVRRFKALWHMLYAVQNGMAGTKHAQMALTHIYRDMERANFSSSILERIPDQTIVLKMKDVYWSDWGSPDRIVESLQFLGRYPSFPATRGANALL